MGVLGLMGCEGSVIFLCFRIIPLMKMYWECMHF